MIYHLLLFDASEASVTALKFLETVQAKVMKLRSFQILIIFIEILPKAIYW